jgi:hypothetical protein
MSTIPLVEVSLLVMETLSFTPEKRAGVRIQEWTESELTANAVFAFSLLQEKIKTTIKMSTMIFIVNDVSLKFFNDASSH